MREGGRWGDVVDIGSSRDRETLSLSLGGGAVAGGSGAKTCCCCVCSGFKTRVGLGRRQTCCGIIRKAEFSEPGGIAGLVLFEPEKKIEILRFPFDEDEPFLKVFQSQRRQMTFVEHIVQRDFD